jgi:hypothetical protein
MPRQYSKYFALESVKELVELPNPNKNDATNFEL